MMQAMQIVVAPVCSARRSTSRIPVLAQRADGSALDAQIRNHANAVRDARRREVPHDTIESPGGVSADTSSSRNMACGRAGSGCAEKNCVIASQAVEHRAAPCDAARIE